MSGHACFSAVSCSTLAAISGVEAATQISSPHPPAPNLGSPPTLAPGHSCAEAYTAPVWADSQNVVLVDDTRCQWSSTFLVRWGRGLPFVGHPEAFIFSGLTARSVLDLHTCGVYASVVHLVQVSKIRFRHGDHSCMPLFCIWRSANFATLMVVVQYFPNAA